jgi:hypothetical protein
MTKQQLKIKAIDSCNRRGHVMGIWMDFDKNSASNTCILCGKSVCVDATPLPNGIEISGEAVSLDDCND